MDNSIWSLEELMRTLGLGGQRQPQTPQPDAVSPAMWLRTPQRPENMPSSPIYSDTPVANTEGYTSPLDFRRSQVQGMADGEEARRREAMFKMQTVLNQLIQQYPNAQVAPGAKEEMLNRMLNQYYDPFKNDKRDRMGVPLPYILRM